MNEIDWVSVVNPRHRRRDLGPAAGWALWYFLLEGVYDSIGSDSYGGFYGPRRVFEIGPRGFHSWADSLIGWGIWGESILASLSSRLSRKRPAKRKRRLPGRGDPQISQIFADFQALVGCQPLDDLRLECRGTIALLQSA